MPSVPATCGQCGSDRIVKYSVHLSQRRRRGGSGCVGCLLFVIILILAPGLVLGVGLAAGAAVDALQVPLLIALAVGAVASIVIKVRQSSMFLCEKCGHKFQVPVTRTSP